jgi:cation diffusion facilitator family transporter
MLGGFASALVLAMVAVGIGFESTLRLWRAEPIDAGTALWVAVIGLVINLLSAWLLHGADGHAGEGHGHSHDHHGHAPHDHDHSSHHAHGEAAVSAQSASGQDLNLRAAYVHVLADAFTSVLAIAALCAALWLGWWWLDPLVGLLGAVVIGVWATGLLRQTAAVLLDREMDHPLTVQIRQAIESDADARVADLHVWRVGRKHHAAIVCVVAAEPLSPADYRERLAGYTSLVHVSVEVNRSPGAADTPA